jgi:hypothetical protein
MLVKVIKKSIKELFARGRKIAHLSDKDQTTPFSHSVSSDSSSIDAQSSMHHLADIKISINEIRTLAIETFGSEAKVDIWLNSPHPILGKTPLSAIETNSGVSEIKKILNAIKYGGVV